MKRNIVLIGLILIAAILSYQIESFEFVMIAFICLSVAFLIAVGVIYIFRKINSKFFTIPLAVICVCLVGVVASLFRPYNEAVLESGNVSEKLEYAYKTDQKDRMLLRSYIFGDIEDRDEVRLNQVKKIYRPENKLEPIDKFHAAFVFHHSNNSNDYETASKLATAAANARELEDNYQVQWLSKAAYDRWMLSIGEPEKYNTQNKFSIGFE